MLFSIECFFSAGKKKSFFSRSFTKCFITELIFWKQDIKKIKKYKKKFKITFLANIPTILKVSEILVLIKLLITILVKQQWKKPYLLCIYKLKLHPQLEL